jgi:hypothetical protein
MAQNHISINTAATAFAADLAQALRGLVSAQEKLTFLKAKMDQMIAGADYTMLESNFGLAAGKGQSTYNLVAGALTTLASDTNLSQLISWVGVPA